MDPKWGPKLTQNGPPMGPKMDPKWDPKWTPFYHFALREPPQLLRNIVYFVRPGALCEHPGYPEMGLRTEPEMIQKWVPKWTLNGAQNGSQMGPKMDPKWDPKWIPFYHFHSVNLLSF